MRLYILVKCQFNVYGILNSFTFKFYIYYVKGKHFYLQVWCIGLLSTVDAF